jgi:prolyl-tRNA synthetase
MPIIRKDKDKEMVMAYTSQLASRLRETMYYGRPIRVEIDDRNIGGARNWDWIKKGIPLRVEIGPKDIETDSVFVGRRDKEHRDKSAIQKDVFVNEICGILDEIQNSMFEKALAYKEKHTRNIDGINEFNAFFTPENKERPEIHGGFSMSHWCGDADCEKRIKERLNVTIRCIPYNQEDEDGACIECGRVSGKRVVFAKAY